MKKLLLFITVIICVHTINAQIPSSCIVPQVLQTYYDGDVKHLALKRIFAQQAPYIDSINVPQNYQDTIWQGLAAIFNLTPVIERDSVFDNYCIHHEASNFIYHSIYVAVDTTYNWTQQWQNLNTTTGITSLDNLLSTYGFTITSFSTFGSNYATLTTTQNINVIPLCDSIETFSGVLYSEPNPPIGFGNEIIYNKVGNDRFYDFTVGYGDCPSGCTGQHTFKFKVYNNCSVDYLGIFDNFDPNGLPAPINCNITTNCNTTSSFTLSDTIICTGDTISLINTSSGTNIYEWIVDGATYSFATDTLIKFDIAGIHTIILIADTGNCRDTSELVIGINPLPSVNLGNDAIVCINDTLALDAGFGHSLYQWSDSSTNQILTVSDTTGVYIYFVSVFDSIGCKATDTIAVTFEMCLGINNFISITYKTLVYPNPSDDFITVEFNNEKKETYMLTIHSLTGQLVQEIANITTGQVKFRKGSMAPGLYFLELRNGTEIVGNGKLIIE